MILSHAALKLCGRIAEWSHKHGLMNRLAYAAFKRVSESHNSLLAANAELSFKCMNLKAENKRLQNELKRGIDDYEFS